MLIYLGRKPTRLPCYQFTCRQRICGCYSWSNSSGIIQRHLHVVLHASTIIFSPRENLCKQHRNIRIVLVNFSCSNIHMFCTLVVLFVVSDIPRFITLSCSIEMIIVVYCTQHLPCFECLAPEIKVAKILNEA